MFDLPLFLLLSAAAVISIAVAVPGQVRAVVHRRADITVPLPIVMVGATAQQALIAVGLAAAGSALAPRFGLAAPWFAAVARGEGLALGEAVAQIPAALLLGGVGTAVFLLLYYRVFRPQMGADVVVRIEEFRGSMGPLGRLLMGGVAEEVMFRWGVMSVMAWICIGLLGLPTVSGMWTAIVLASLLFGLGHLPGVAAVGVRLTGSIVSMAIALNMVVSLVFGWLFWQHGLLAAVVAHTMLHAVWYQFEERSP